MSHSNFYRRRRTLGTTVVEVAVVLPVFLVFLFGLIAYGHACMISNMMKGATRAAARFGAPDNVTTAQAEAKARQILSGGMNPALITIQIKDASAYDNGDPFPTDPAAMTAMPDIELNTAAERQLFMVRASVNYNDVAILPTSWFNNLQLSGQAFMRHE